MRDSRDNIKRRRHRAADFTTDQRVLMLEDDVDEQEANVGKLLKYLLAAIGFLFVNLASMALNFANRVLIGQ